MAKDLVKITFEKRGKNKQLTVPTPRERFIWKKRGNQTLVLPEANANWTEESRVFRSMIFDRDGRVLSLGLPKFFLWQQDAPWTSRFLEDKDLGEWQALIKYDGILVIRSVIKGVVHFRTRNSFDGEHHTDNILRIVKEKYPALLDPDLYPEGSLHFEYLTPSHRIVIPYAREDLIFLGGVSHKTLLPFSWDEVKKLSQENDLTLAQEEELNFSSFEELQSLVNQRRDIEGIVLRWQDGRHLLKVKNSLYEEAQRKRYEFNPRKLRRLILDKKIENIDDLARRVGIGEGDPLMAYIASIFNLHLDLEIKIETELRQLSKMSEENKILTKKQFGAIAKALGSPRGEALLKVKQGNLKAARELLENKWAREYFSDKTDQDFA